MKNLITCARKYLASGEGCEVWRAKSTISSPTSPENCSRILYKKANLLICRTVPRKFDCASNSTLRVNRNIFIRQYSNLAWVKKRVYDKRPHGRAKYLLALRDSGGMMKILCSRRGEAATLDAYLHFQQAPLAAGLRRMAEARIAQSFHTRERRSRREIIIGT